MRRYVSILSWFVWIGAILVFFSSPVNAAGDEGYAGAGACYECHRNYYDTYVSSIHAKKAIRGSPANKAECESCHGNASKHAEEGKIAGSEIFAFGRKADSRVKSEKCLSCHEESKTIAFWNMSRHNSGGVSCDGCHSAHAKGKHLLKAEEPDLCFGCHRDIRFQTNKQSHHPVNEKLVTRQKLTCSSCHNTMGGFGPGPMSAFSTRSSFGTDKMIRADSINELCYQCHTEKRGPFAWEHAPVAENCLSCHEAHGSNHSSLLTQKPPLTCQNCHDLPSHPSQPYTNFQRFLGAGGSKNRFISRACLNCHTNIHGSNFPGNAGQFFIR